MAIPTKSLDDMIREVKASLQTGEPPRPAYTLLIGSGFSFPIIPTPTEMLRGDIAWWRYGKARKFSGAFRHRAEGIADGSAKESDVIDFERELWKEIHGWASASAATAFSLTAAGLPDLTDPSATGRAYHAVMSKGLMSNKMRRQYLRDAIERSYPRVNAAHIFLAGILEAQETWEWPVPFCRTIFTTNFDPLLQRSLQLVNKLYYMSDRPDVLEPPDDGESDAIHLVYTHGSVHRYDLLNTEEQIEKARARNAPTLIDYFRRHGVIVIGYSGWADTTMEALASCPAFDSNLYWCDIHPAADAESKLRPEVLKVLQAREKNAFYVPIAGADEAMRLLHRELNLGPVPKFMLAPVSTMIDQLKSIKVPSEPVVNAAAELTPTLAKLLEDTLTRLEVAKSAFDDPSIVQPHSAKGQEGVEKALVAQLLSDAYVAYSQGKRDQAIALWTTVADMAGVPAEDRAKALFNRAFTWGLLNEPAKEIADYTAVIEMPGAAAKERAKALYNRGVTSGQRGQTRNEIEDYTAVIEMPDAPADEKADALYNRGVAYGQSGDKTKEIEDYTAVIDMPDASPEQKADALNARAITWRNRADFDRGIADYTAAIEMVDAPPAPKAHALSNRAIMWAQRGEIAREIADYTAIIEMPGAPAEQKADALLSRAVALGPNADPAKAIADYTAVIDMRGASAEQKAKALNNRAEAWEHAGQTVKEIADYTEVIEMLDAPRGPKARALHNRGWRRFAALGDVWGMIDDSTKALAIEDDPAVRPNLALGLLLSGQAGAASAEYENFLSRTSSASLIGEAITDLEDALQQRPPIPEAAAILERLRSALPPST